MPKVRLTVTESAEVSSECDGGEVPPVGPISGDCCVDLSLGEEPTVDNAGIPLDLSYRLLDGDLGLYVSAGGGLEKGITGVQTCQVTARNGSVSRDRVSQGVAGVQPYADLSLGLSYRLDRRILLYIEPGMAYYFDTRQPMSARTKHPLNMSLSAGFRFSL